MKKIFTILSLFTICLFFANDSSAQAKFEWDKTEIDLGKIKHNEPVTLEYTFTNSGSAVLVITHAKGSCGCTSVDYPRDPILPTSEGKINAVFDASMVGVFKKSITITSNTGKSEVVTFKGEVVE